MVYPKSFIVKLVMLGFISLLLSCTDDVEPQPAVSDVSWQPAGLETHSIFDLVVADGVLTAATEEKVYQIPISDTQSDEIKWNNLELNIEHNFRRINSIVKEDPENIMAALILGDIEEIEEGTPSLYITDDGGSSWSPVHSEKESSKDFTQVRIVEAQEPKNPSLEAIYGEYRGGIVGSTDQGQTWQMLYKDYALFIQVSPHHPEKIWIGAHVEGFAPSLGKSEDGGASWTPLFHEIQDAVSGAATAQAALLHPVDPQIALVGLTSSGTSNNKAVLSQDGGETFETVLEEAGIRTMAHGIESEERVYASGQHITGKPFVAISPDFGINWETFVYEDAEIEDRVFAREMVVVNRNGQEVVYLATNKGVFQAEVH